jgi:peptide/nickel transport system ATP-binding protein
MERNILSVNNLSVGYSDTRGALPTLKDVTFGIGFGETVGLVGESGCGKSTLGKAIVRLLRPTAGTIHVDDEDITDLSEAALLPVRRKVQMVFQDPYGSLNPRLNVMTLLDRPLQVHGVRRRSERHKRVFEIIDKIGISRSMLDRYPHEFSGGQRQRIGIARALVLNPALVVCDEPVSALDLSIQAQILNLLVDLKREMGLAYLFISHDLSVVRYIADRVLVMYKGRIVESGRHDTLWMQPLHPYSRSLLGAVPKPVPGLRPKDVTGGDAVRPAALTGCLYRTRCSIATDRCRVETPPLRPLSDGSAVACHLA